MSGVLVIENYPGTPLGLVGDALASAGHAVTLVAAHAGETIPGRHGGHVGLIVLGGEQNALADDSYPFLPDVCGLIHAFHDADRPVLGICLGAQLIARAFGGANILDRPIEFGWHSVAPTEEGRGDPMISVLGTGAPLFHWHSDTVALPEGAVHLASSRMTPNQAFRLGRATYGIQFHFEAAEPIVRVWSGMFADSIARHSPDWSERLDREASLSAADADRTGAALARAWARLL